MRFATLALALTLLATPAFARTWDQTWSVGAHPVIMVETNDAHVFIHKGAAGRVEGHIEYTINVWGMHSEIRDPRIVLERQGDTIRVSAHPRSTIAVFGGVTERFKIEVTVPGECDVQVRSRDGAVDVEPVSGHLDVQTGDGHITVHGARGEMRLWTGDGGIDADGLDGALTGRTGDGHLRVSGRFDRMDVRSGDGRVEATVLRGSALAGAWEFASGDGSITLRIPRNLQALLDASTNDGRVRVELPVNLGDRRSHHDLRGQLNGGTVPLRVRTGDGSITFALSE